MATKGGALAFAFAFAFAKQKHFNRRCNFLHAPPSRFALK
jgi:hypothetical protein